VDIDGNNAFQIKAIGVVISTFETLPRGQMLEVEIGLETVQYALREGERLVIRHEKEEIQLTRDHPQAVRSVSRW
jgi:alpha,alpha-trehalose phosphorylase